MIKPKLKQDLPAKAKNKPKRRKGAPTEADKRKTANRAVIIVIGGLIAIAMFAAVIIPSFIDTSRYKTLFAEQFLKLTGHEVTIRGEVSLYLLPTPSVLFRQVEIKPPPDRTDVPTLRMEALSVGTDFASVFSEKTEIQSMKLIHPVVEIARGKSKRINWDWLSGSMLTHMSPKGKSSDGLTLHQLSITDGKVYYLNENTEFREVIDAINLAFNMKTTGEVDINGHLKYHANDVNIAVAMGAPDAAGKTQSVNLSLNSGRASRLQLKGNLYTDAAQDFQGDLELELENIYPWVRKPVEKVVHEQLDASGKPIVEVPPTPIPIKLTSKASFKGDLFRLDDTDFSSGDATVGKGLVEFLWQQNLQVSTAFRFSLLDLTRWEEFWSALHASKARQANPEIPTDFGQEEEPQNVFPEDLSVNTMVVVDKLLINGEVWQDLFFSGEMDQGLMVVDQFTIGSSAESQISLFGIVTTDTGEAKFEGNVETSGKDLRTVLATIDPEAKALPDLGFSRGFSATANLLISPQQVRVSEANLQIGDFRLVGGLVAYNEDQPRIEAEIKLKGINLDYFRDAWRDEKIKRATSKDSTSYNQKVDFSWLKNLKTKIDFRIDISKFTFLDKEGESASVRLTAKAGEVGLYGLKMYYTDSIIDGNLHLDVAGEVPVADVVVTANSFDTSYLSVQLPEKSKAERAAEVMATQAHRDPNDAGKWSEDLFDFSWMYGYNANFDVSLVELVMGPTTFENVKFKASLENNTLNVQKLNFGIWGGGFEGAGTLVGGRVPGMSGRFTFYNAELSNLTTRVSKIDNITGRVSLSGVVSASGINFRSWVEQAEAKVVMTGRGMQVRNLNIQGVLDSVGAARSVADVVNSVPKALVDGSTEFSVDGNINVSGGLVKTPGVQLRVGYTTGNVTGEIKLIPWTMTISSLFSFPNLTSETIPTLRISLSGPVDNTVLKMDTSSLEAYVAKRIIGK
jgi:hypothetical protein